VRLWKECTEKVKLEGEEERALAQRFQAECADLWQELQAARVKCDNLGIPDRLRASSVSRRGGKEEEEEEDEGDEQEAEVEKEAASEVSMELVAWEEDSQVCSAPPSPFPPASPVLAPASPLPFPRLSAPFRPPSSPSALRKRKLGRSS
jgi:hypothetical protein